MHISLVLVCVVLLQSTVQAVLLPSTFYKARQLFGLLGAPAALPQQTTKIPPTNHMVHALYNNPKSYHLRPHQSLQQTLQPQDDNTKEVGAGTIHILSTANHHVPIDFTLSSSICPLGTDALRMANELASWVLASHSSGTKGENQTIQETVKLNTRRAEYRAMLSLKLDGEIEAGPFLGLVNFLERTTEALFAETGDRGFGTLMERGEFEGVVFEAWWTWYEFVGGVGRRCMEDNLELK